MSKFLTICPACYRERKVTRCMVNLIKRGENTGKCKSCSLRGNKYRYTEVYDKNLYQTRLYKIWSNMKSRCSNPNIESYKRYGGRGISYCKKWETFKGFLGSIPKGYREDLTLDRIDNNEGYSIKNCRWVSYIEQANNTRRNNVIEFKGQKKTISQWARYCGIKVSTLGMRLGTYGWSLEKALSFNIKR